MCQGFFFFEHSFLNLSVFEVQWTHSSLSYENSVRSSVEGALSKFSFLRSNSIGRKWQQSSNHTFTFTEQLKARCRLNTTHWRQQWQNSKGKRFSAQQGTKLNLAFRTRKTPWKLAKLDTDHSAERHQKHGQQCHMEFI